MVTYVILIFLKYDLYNLNFIVFNQDDVCLQFAY